MCKISEIFTVVQIIIVFIDCEKRKKWRKSTISYPTLWALIIYADYRKNFTYFTQILETLLNSRLLNKNYNARGVSQDHAQAVSREQTGDEQIITKYIGLQKIFYIIITVN